MTNAEEMAMKTVHDLGVAGDWDVCNYTGLSPVEAGWALDALCRKEYLKVVSTKCECDANEHGEVINVEVFTLFELTPEGKEAAQKIPDINEPMCIPITNITFEKMEELKYGITIYAPTKNERTVLTDAAFLPDKETAEKVHSLSGWAYKSNSQEQRATV